MPSCRSTCRGLRLCRRDPAPDAEVAVVVVELRAPGIGRRRARACRVLPLRFRRQAISVVLAGFPVEPADEVLRVEPARADDGPRAAAPILVVGIRLTVFLARLERRFDGHAVAPTIADARFPLVPRDGRARQRERPRERDLALRLVLAALGLVGRRPHREFAGRQHHHLGTVAALLERLARRKLRRRGAVALCVCKQGNERGADRQRQQNGFGRHGITPGRPLNRLAARRVNCGAWTPARDAGKNGDRMRGPRLKQTKN